MRKNLNDIIIEDLQAEHDEIIDYRKAVASGIEDYADPVLADAELTEALKKVIDYYKTKADGYISYDNSFAAGPGFEFDETIQFGDIKFGDNYDTSNDR
jgi:hypothetical protein